MTHFSDGVEIGNLDWINVGPLPKTNLVTYSITPVALNAAGIAASQTMAAAGDLLINGTAAVTASSPSYAVLDVPRRVTITSVGNDSGMTFTVYGTDTYGYVQTQTVTGGNAAAVTTLKAFKSVSRIAASAATAGAVTAGWSDALGLPVRAIQGSYVASVRWNTALAPDAGTFVAADVTAPATAATGDPRGIYTPSSVADGVKHLLVCIAVDNPGDVLTTFGVKPV